MDGEALSPILTQKGKEMGKGKRKAEHKQSVSNKIDTKIHLLIVNRRSPAKAVCGARKRWLEEGNVQGNCMVEEEEEEKVEGVQ